jgi:sporulation protein YlmC with PRC-barrel domain
MRWIVFGAVFALALSPAGAPWAQQQGATPSTPSDSSTTQPAPSGSSTSQSTPTSQSPTPSVNPSMPSQNQTGLQIDSKSLVGSTVRGEDGKDLGHVANLMIDANDGRVTAVVITMGKLVGVGGTGITVGGKDVTVPWSGIKLGRDQEKFVVTLQQTMMPAASPPSR